MTVECVARDSHHIGVPAKAGTHTAESIESAQEKSLVPIAPTRGTSVATLLWTEVWRALCIRCIAASLPQ